MSGLIWLHCGCKMLVEKKNTCHILYLNTGQGWESFWHKRTTYKIELSSQWILSVVCNMAIKMNISVSRIYMAVALVLAYAEM